MKKARVLATLTAATLVAACGVQPTGVIPAGPGPSIRPTTGATVMGGVTLYFVSEGRVIPVTRPTEGFISPEGALMLLLKGPSEEEAAQGLTTFVPPEVSGIGVSSGDPGYISLPFSARKLSGQAVNQLVCTAMSASTAMGRAPRLPGMTVISPDGEAQFQACKSG
ncbi:MAG TPA: hypothetical protein VM533_13010 [Fimbriiglobus sp.]|nr:hypothetical protein [Fimbriiglobus sp.]